jgi:hypothetical protein
MVMDAGDVWPVVEMVLLRLTVAAQLKYPLVANLWLISLHRIGRFKDKGVIDFVPFTHARVDRGGTMLPDEKRTEMMQSIEFKLAVLVLSGSSLRN